MTQINLLNKERILQWVRFSAGTESSAQIKQRLTEDGNSAASVIASSAVLDGRIWLERSPWRLAGGWTMAGALLAAGFFLDPTQIEPIRLVLLFLLIDLFWGSIWGAMTLPNSLPNLEQHRHQRRVWLPYLQADSPAARLFGVDKPGILAVILRVALPGIGLAGIVSAILGPSLLPLTAIVVVISLGSWLHRQISLVPVLFLHSLISVALPWWAIYFQLDPLGLVGFNDYWILGVLWTLHVWGGNRLLVNRVDRPGLAMVVLAQLGIILLLILAQTPLWLAILSVLWLPTWLTLYRRHALWSVELWWLLAFLISAFAVGQRLLV